MEKLNLDQMENLNGGIDLGCIWFLKDRVGLWEAVKLCGLSEEYTNTPGQTT